MSALVDAISNGSGRLSGEIKFFNEEDGYGFIICPHLRKDVFLHKKELAGLQVDKGTKVSFVLESDKRGFRATEVALMK